MEKPRDETVELEEVSVSALVFHITTGNASV
jgi:hypothetical protein